MSNRLATVAIIAALAGGIAHGKETDTDATQRIAAALQTAQLTSADRKTLLYVETAHAQLDNWGARLVARLERGLAPRQSDPMLDGRAELQVQKLRLTYAESTPSPALAEAIRHLADTHEQRLQCLDRMLRYGLDRARYTAARADVHSAIRLIRDRGSD